MDLVPALLAVDTPSALRARAMTEHDLRDRALRVGEPCRLPAICTATAAFELRVDASHLEPPPISARGE